MSETPSKPPRPRLQVSCLAGTLAILLATVLLFILFGPVCGRRHPPVHGHVACMANLRQLGLCLIVYSDDNEGQYPSPERWCDVLIAHWHADRDLKKHLCCPQAEMGPCNYAMNPAADPCSAPDVVLLFESKPGWNQFGGAELLTTDNHKGQGCSVSFVDGTVRFVKADEIDGLRWKDEGTRPSGSHSSRRSASDEE